MVKICTAVRPTRPANEKASSRTLHDMVVVCLLVKYSVWINLPPQSRPVVKTALRHTDEQYYCRSTYLIQILYTELLLSSTKSTRVSQRTLGSCTSTHTQLAKRSVQYRIVPLVPVHFKPVQPSKKAKRASNAPLIHHTVSRYLYATRQS